MKTIKNGSGEIQRVADEVATSLVDAKKAVYVPKKDWKKIRDEKHHRQRT